MGENIVYGVKLKINVNIDTDDEQYGCPSCLLQFPVKNPLHARFEEAHVDQNNQMHRSNFFLAWAGICIIMRKKVAVEF